MRRTTGIAVGLVAGVAWVPVVDAAPGAGTIDDPIVIDALPYFAAGSTVGAPSSAIDAYDCDAGLDESGAEVVYRFELPTDAHVTAWVEADDGVVDVDVHLLDTLVLEGTLATGCVARNNTIAEADMAAGEHWVVADSFAGAAQRGPFVLRIYAIGETWSEIPVGEGVVWRARRFMDDDGPQVEHAVDVDLSVPGVSLEVVDPDGCQTVSTTAASLPTRPVAAVNSSFFSFDGVCTATTFMKHAGTVLSAGGGASLGLTDTLVPMVSIVAGGDWPEVSEAQGGRGLLVDGGVATQGDAAWNAQGLTSASFLGPNPRTMAGYRADGTIVLATVDGRRPNAFGKSMDGLAAFALDELGCEGAVNWDGGGSTTMWVADMTPNGVVNYPSDGGMSESMEHAGSRANGGSVHVHAMPYNWPPRFQTQPPVADAAVGDTYAYDADAIDLDVDDVVAYAMVEGPDGMTIDAATGELSFAPTPASPPMAMVTIMASDGEGGASTQTWPLTIAGGMGGGDGGSGSDGGGSAGDGTGPGPGGGGTVGSDDGGTGATAGSAERDESGCGCRGTQPRPAAVGALALVVLATRRRRRR